MNRRLFEKNKEFYIKQMTPVFDHDYLESIKHIPLRLRSDVLITGLEETRHLVDDENKKLLFTSEHVAHADYVELIFLFHTQGIKMPAVVGGTNLLIWWLTEPHFPIHKPLIVDFSRAPYIGIKRDFLKGRDEGDLLYQKLFHHMMVGLEGLDKGSDIYNQLTSNVDPSLFGNFDKYNILVFNKGRTYDGNIRKFNVKVVDQFKEHSELNGSSEHLAIPIVISYEDVIDVNSFRTVEWIKKEIPEKIKDMFGKGRKVGIINDFIKKHADKTGSIFDIVNYREFYNSDRPRGEVYIDFLPPINVSASDHSSSSIKSDIANAINSNIRITPTSLMASCLKSLNSDFISYETLTDKIAEMRDAIKGLPVTRVLQDQYSAGDIVDRAYLFLSQGRKNPVLANVDGGFKVDLNSFLVSYYLNRITHHLGPKH